MMNTYVICEVTTGKCVQTCNAASIEEVERICNENQVPILVDVAFKRTDNYYSNGVLKPLGDKPSINHVFNWSTKQWEDPRTAATEWLVVKATRDSRLSASDWTQLADAPQDKRVWAVYRQALRDITKQADPFKIVWPVAPSP